jgi:hypothetical protein
LQEGVLGETHQRVIMTMDSLANALSTSGRYSRALEYYEEFLSGLESIDDVSNRWHAEAAIFT